MTTKIDILIIGAGVSGVGLIVFALCMKETAPHIRKPVPSPQRAG